ncbi:choice-of-anchor I family protein [Psychroserpens sp.]
MLVLFLLTLILGCSDDDNNTTTQTQVSTEVNFQYLSTINIGGKGASEISAYDPVTGKLFTVNVESNQISVHNISDLEAITQETPINLSAFGSPNSVAVFDEKLAVAVEAPIKQNLGQILVFDTNDSSLISQYTVGALPDMVTFTKNGHLILSANEGEPNDDYTIDPIGSVSIIDLTDDSVTTLDFTSFNDQLSCLKSEGLRVFSPNASLAQDIEPEYIAVSDDNNTAWVALQENNALAKINLVSKTIESILPLGYKDFSLPGNEIDVSDKDGEVVLKNWPVFGMYQPDGITYTNINGVDYVISANEGDSRDYDGFSEEDRVNDLDLDETVFPATKKYQDDANLGRLKITNTLGDIDDDGDYDALYSYGARSFSIWSANGNLIYDSGNTISQILLTLSPESFADKRSDNKGVEPESVEVLNIANQRYILFVCLERTSQVMVFDITNPTSPEFLSILSRSGDIAPEGLLVIPRKESPNGKDLLLVSNEVSGTVSIYQNE